MATQMKCLELVTMIMSVVVPFLQTEGIDAKTIHDIVDKTLVDSGGKSGFFDTIDKVVEQMSWEENK